MIKIRDLDTHRLIAQRQSAAYKYNKINLPDNTLMIELDWKQKVLIGMDSYTIFLKTIQYNFHLIKTGLSPRQVSGEFRLQEQRTLIGFGIFYRKDHRIQCMNIDLVSNNQGQAGYDTVNAFRYVFARN